MDFKRRVKDFLMSDRGTGVDGVIVTRLPVNDDEINNSQNILNNNFIQDDDYSKDDGDDTLIDRLQWVNGELIDYSGTLITDNDSLEDVSSNNILINNDGVLNLEDGTGSSRITKNLYKCHLRNNHYFEVIVFWPSMLDEVLSYIDVINNRVNSNYKKKLDYSYNVEPIYNTARIFINGGTIKQREDLSIFLEEIIAESLCDAEYYFNRSDEKIIKSLCLKHFNFVPFSLRADEAFKHFSWLSYFVFPRFIIQDYSSAHVNFLNDLLNLKLNVRVKSVSNDSYGFYISPVTLLNPIVV